MKEFKKVNKVFKKSNNSTNKIFNRYLFCLIPFILIHILYNIIVKDYNEIIFLLKSIILSIIICIVTEYVINFKKNKTTIKSIVLEDNILTIAIILGLFSIHSNIIIIIISSIVSIIIKKYNKNAFISSSLYGILIILITNYFLKVDTPLFNLSKLTYIGTFNEIVTKYGNIFKYIIYNQYYLSPLISLLIFIYLFNKKSIKYNLIISYIFSFTLIMLFIGIFNGMNIWYLYFQLTTGNILFLAIYGLADYPNSPITTEGQIIYGIIIAIITSILRFIIPELSAIISIILGQIFLVKYIDKLSIKLKYNKRLYQFLLIVSIITAILIILIISMLI